MYSEHTILPVYQDEYGNFAKGSNNPSILPYNKSRPKRLKIKMPYDYSLFNQIIVKPVNFLDNLLFSYPQIHQALCLP